MSVGARAAVVLRILCALALLMFGFTGDAFADASQDPFSAQYRLPDGSYSSLCQPGEQKGNLPHNGTSHCGSCLTAASHAFTPTESVSAAGPSMQRGEAFDFAEIANIRRILSHHVQGRGPPLLA